MKVTPGSTDVTTYFVLRLAASGVEATGLTITNFDLTYVRSGAAPAAKVDASWLVAADSAHADNSAVEVQITDQPGLYRVDWPDAAFAAGVREVILTVKCATVFTEHLRVELEPLQTGDSFARLGAPAGASIAADLAAIEAQTDDIGAAGAGLTALASQASVNTIDDLLDTEIAAILAAVDTEVAAIKAKTDQLVFSVANELDANLRSIRNDPDGATNLDRSTRAIVLGTVGAASTTTSIVTSALDPAAVVTDQFKGRIVIFDKDTVTAALRGQATDIIANTALGVLAVTDLTVAPSSGDTFTIT